LREKNNVTDQYDEEYYDEIEQHRYLYTVRQRFNEKPRVDTFYELQVPSGLTGEQAKIMTKLDESWCKDEISSDVQALNHMGLRLRFNSDAYPKVCMVRTHAEITAEELESILVCKFNEGELAAFLDESAV
jgi:hypothetical protein